MRVADYLIDALHRSGIETAFTVCGGGSAFLNDAMEGHEGMRYIACHGEQAASMAAEAYARVRTGLGLCVVTSGPGATNAITGVAGAWADSVPLVVLSGQSFVAQTSAGRGLRQLGVQEINIIELVASITKYAHMVREAKNIRWQLERAIWCATHARPGPVWLDIPADIQAAEIDPDTLAPYLPPDRKPVPGVLSYDARTVANLLRHAKRPLVHVGQGVRLAGALDDFFQFVEGAGIPFITARNANDICASDHPNYIGRAGTFAQRGANFAVQTCDLYLAIGTRLSLAQTGYNAKDYARNANIVMVDIDAGELAKGTARVDVPIQADAKEFLRELRRQME